MNCESKEAVELHFYPLGKSHKLLELQLLTLYNDKNKERVYTKRRPKREAMSGFKMSYRYKYYNQENSEEEDDEEL